MPLDGSAPPKRSRPAPEDEFQAAFSPDGSIVFHAVRERHRAAATCTRSRPPEASGPASRADAQQPRAALSPDGRSLLYRVGRPGRQHGAGHATPLGDTGWDSLTPVFSAPLDHPGGGDWSPMALGAMGGGTPHSSRERGRSGQRVLAEIGPQPRPSTLAAEGVHRTVYYSGARDYGTLHVIHVVPWKAGRSARRLIPEGPTYQDVPGSPSASWETSSTLCWPTGRAHPARGALRKESSAAGR